MATVNVYRLCCCAVVAELMTHQLQGDKQTDTVVSYELHSCTIMFSTPATFSKYLSAATDLLLKRDDTWLNFLECEMCHVFANIIGQWRETWAEFWQDLSWYHQTHVFVRNWHVTQTHEQSSSQSFQMNVKSVMTWWALWTINVSNATVSNINSSKSTAESLYLNKNVTTVSPNIKKETLPEINATMVSNRRFNVNTIYLEILALEKITHEMQCTLVQWQYKSMSQFSDIYQLQQRSSGHQSVLHQTSEE